MPSANAPVYLVLTEVRFNPIMNLEAYIPAIQERLRRNGFPDYQPRTTQRLIMPMIPGENAPAPIISSQTSFVFADMQGEQILTLNPNALSFQTTVHENFSVFSAKFLECLEIIHETIELTYFDRIGVRYLDAVVPSESEKFEDYLVREVIGLKGLLMGEVAHSTSEILIKDGADQLIARSYLQNGGLVIPAELEGHAPKFQPRFLGIDGWHAVLDNDAAFIARETFSIDRVKEILLKLRERVFQSFKTMVTLEALTKWGI